MTLQSLDARLPKPQNAMHDISQLLSRYHFHRSELERRFIFIQSELVSKLTLVTLDQFAVEPGTSFSMRSKFAYAKSRVKFAPRLCHFVLKKWMKFTQSKKSFFIQIFLKKEKKNRF